MNEQFTPYRRSQVWLGEPSDAAAYHEEGTRIAERLRGLNSHKLFDVAADESVDDRTRWEAALRLPRGDAQRLADMLIQRSDDYWWATIHLPPTSTQCSKGVKKCQINTQNHFIFWKYHTYPITEDHTE